jgi:hypothetical protein
MIFGSERRGVACHLPLGSLFGSLFLGGFSAFELTHHQLQSAGISALFTLAIVAYFLSELRWMNARSGRLAVKTVLKEHSLAVANIALGIRVSYSTKGFHTYTVYALASGEEVSLASAGSAKRAERMRTRLAQVLLAGRLDSSAADAAQKVIQTRELQWRGHEQAARSQIDAYYASGKFRRTGIWIAVIVGLYCLSMGIFMALHE